MNGIIRNNPGAGLRARKRLSSALSFFVLRLAIAVILALIALPVHSEPVRADTVTLRPNAAGAATNLTLVGAATNWQAVADVTADGDTTRVENTAGNQKIDLYNLTDSSAPVGKVTGLTITVVAARTGSGGNLTIQLRTNNITYADSSSQSLTASYVSYNNLDATWATTNPNTGKAWTWSDINSLQVGVALSKGKATQIYVTVTYTAAAADSYQDSGHGTLWGDTIAEAYNSTYNMVYIWGTNFTASHSYTVAYYDSAGTMLGLGDSVSSDATNNLSSSYLLSTDPGAIWGTWHAQVFDTDIGSPPGSYNASATGLVYNVAFEVASSAIPEFPTVMAALAVAGISFAIYWRMRRRLKNSMNEVE